MPNEIVTASDTVSAFEMQPIPDTGAGGITVVEQSRAVAEVQASIVVAQANPRNEHLAVKGIMNACKRPKLAESASYIFRRGRDVITGPSIRLAETIARYWGNIQYGYREIGQGDGYSEVEAYCHDLQTNVRVTRNFRVYHRRETKKGTYGLTSDRDKYEHVANMAQRRVRACILEVVPGDVVEAAEEACRATLEQSIGNVEEQVEKILGAFVTIGVTQEEIESYMQRPVTSITPVDIVQLRRIFTSIRDGIALKRDFFPEPDEVDQALKKAKSATKKAAPAKKKATAKKAPPAKKAPVKKAPAKKKKAEDPPAEEPPMPPEPPPISRGELKLGPEKLSQPEKSGPGGQTQPVLDVPDEDLPPSATSSIAKPAGVIKCPYDIEVMMSDCKLCDERKDCKPFNEARRKQI